MKLTILTAAAALLAAGAVSAASPKTPQATKGSTASENHVVVPKPDALQFQTAPNALPPGAQLVVLQGDMTKPGPFTARIRVPANYRIPPHHHPVNEHVTVISGAVGIGMGDKFDETKLQQVATGGFFMMPAGHKHFLTTTSEAVIQLHGTGPWGIVYVNPADDPRNRGTGGTGQPSQQKQQPPQVR